MHNKNKWLLIVCLTMALPFSGGAATLLTQNFDNISSLPGSGWVLVNNSAPAGTNGWFQGNNSIFNAQAGAANAYIGANFSNAAFGGNISNWLILPTMTLDPTAILSFYTRTETGPLAPDRLEIRFSPNGASSNVGATDTSVGDFTTLLLTINPAQTAGVYPTDWTQFQVSLASLAVPTSGRLAFRYFVSNTAANGDYIGIDTVQVTGAIPEPSTVALSVGGIISILGVCRHGRRATKGEK